MANKIDTVTARNKLKTRREPYWHRISKGFYVGFRKMSDSSSGTWLLQHCEETGTTGLVDTSTFPVNLVEFPLVLRHGVMDALQHTGL